MEVAECCGLRGRHAKSVLQCEHSITLVDATNLQVSPVISGNRILVSVREVRKCCFSQRAHRVKTHDGELHDVVVDFTGIDHVDDLVLIGDSFGAVVVGQDAVNK